MATQARREREREQRRLSILHAARAVFFEEGFHRATVGDVANRAEVSKGTVYLYFESKQALIAHLLLATVRELVEELQGACPSVIELSASEQLRRISWAYLHFFEREPRYLQLLMAVDRGRFRETVSADVYDEVFRTSLVGLNVAVDAIERGVVEGALVCSDPRQAAAVVWATLNGVLELMQHPLRRQMVRVEREALYAFAIEMLIQALNWRSDRGPSD